MSSQRDDDDNDIIEQKLRPETKKTTRTAAPKPPLFHAGEVSLEPMMLLRSPATTSTTMKGKERKIYRTASQKKAETTTTTTMMTTTVDSKSFEAEQASIEPMRPLRTLCGANRMNRDISNVSNHLPTKTTEAATITIPTYYESEEEQQMAGDHRQVAMTTTSAWESQPEPGAERVRGFHAARGDSGTVVIGEGAARSLADIMAQAQLVEEPVIVKAEVGAPDRSGELVQRFDQMENRRRRQIWIFAAVLVLVVAATIIVVSLVVGRDDSPSTSPPSGNPTPQPVIPTPTD
eukprot:CAMPEP_0194033662 /NCGR_PEP_ID=MMETSP0009_2-20130614/6258_1 /TAXON_ID=210454 /ORGANISM="Grammatophora oceanica, Strain CCMP 410" /LENGTH=290 /DNA_ID=CAMNT_0038674379 /DNA_START=938 /DNA_END=1810 /DNA_ORIENTATION=+